MSPPHPDAVGSYGPGAVRWVEGVERKTLRWWQRLAVVRQLEHREDGSLCWRNVLESCPRRAGKSVRMRGIALWRMAHADLFGEVQTIVHTGSDVPICREIQRGAWPWAGAQGWTIVRALNRESMETEDGDRWLVRSQDAVYGYDVTFGIVDEAWDVKPDTVSEGLEPATLERLSPQVHMTSTAHRRARSTMKTRLRDALTSEDDETLVMLWGAPADADPGDPAVWRAASPHWSEDRRKMIAGKYSKALAGEADPSADDPDPMEGFKAQYLNIWPMGEAKAARGNGVIGESDWAELVYVVPQAKPSAAAIESWYAEGVSLALAYKHDDRVVVSVTDHADLSSAAATLRLTGFRGTATVGASLLEDSALTGVRTRKGALRVGASVGELQRLLSEDAFGHDGGEHLTGQVLGARTLPGADGPRMATTGRADAIKVAVWAVTECRRKSAGRIRIVTAS
jgi:hypothetical protein